MSVSAAANPWRPENGTDIERVVVGELRDRLQAENDRGAALRQDAIRRFDELVEPQMERDRSQNLGLAWKINGIAVGVGALAVGVGMAIAGARGMASPMLGTSVAGNFLRGAGMGAVGTGMFTGAVTGLVGIASPGDMFESTDAQRAAWPEETRQAYDDRNRYWAPKVPYWELQRATEWQPGAQRHGTGSETVTDWVAGIAGFDHDGDGAVDLASGSAELRRDANGGPVTAATQQIRTLPKLLREADADLDGSLVPGEAIRAAVTAEVLREHGPYWGD